jgi:hypothetical protein
MDEQTPADPDRRSGDADAHEALSPEIVRLLMLCGAEVREADRSAVVASRSASAQHRSADRRDRDRRHVERRFSERRQDERRATAS